MTAQLEKIVLPEKIALLKKESVLATEATVLREIPEVEIDLSEIVILNQTIDHLEERETPQATIDLSAETEIHLAVRDLSVVEIEIALLVVVTVLLLTVS